MGNPNEVPKITWQEYLEGEQDSEVKNEYRFGIVTAMVGGTFNHALIKSNIEATLRNLEGCVTVSSDVKVETLKENIYYYPDVMVICGDKTGRDEYTVDNPFLIVEVLSKSTKDKDRGEKFEDYRRIASLKHYIVVSQWQYHLVHHERLENGSWLLRDYSSYDDKFSIKGVVINLQEVYGGVKFWSELV